MGMISDRVAFINLSTRKRDGSFVNTPVWFAQAGETNSYFLYSLKKAGKVKRIRNFPDVKIAPCTYSGKLKGDWVEAAAYLVDDPEDIKNAYVHLKAKYGLKFRIGDLFSWLYGNFHRRQIIKINLPPKPHVATNSRAQP